VRVHPVHLTNVEWLKRPPTQDQATHHRHLLLLSPKADTHLIMLSERYNSICVQVRCYSSKVVSSATLWSSVQALQQSSLTVLLDSVAVSLAPVEPWLSVFQPTVAATPSFLATAVTARRACILIQMAQRSITHCGKVTTARVITM